MWSAETEEGFVHLKKVHAFTPILAMPDLSYPYLLKHMHQIKELELF